MTTNGKYPECEKMSEVHEFSQRCGEFVTWLNEEHGILLAKYDTKQDACRNCEHPEKHDYRPYYSSFGQCAHTEHEDGTCDHGSECEHFGACDCDHADFGNPDRLYPQGATLEKLLAGFFDIDLEAVEAEKRQMLSEMREASLATSR